MDTLTTDIPYKSQITDYAKTLKLSGIRTSFNATMETATREKWAYDRFLTSLLLSEISQREENRKRGQIRKAGFPQLKYLEDFNRTELPEDMAVVLPELETLDFVKNAQNLVLFGNPGMGKTHCAIGLGIKACLQGYSVLYTSVPHLLTRIRECESQKKLGQLQRKFEKYDLVICDEFGYISFNKEGAEALFNHISLRAGRKSTIITTNLSFDRWDEIFTDKILATAMVDRLTHKSYIVNMNGISYRLKETQEWMNKRNKNAKTAKK